MALSDQLRNIANKARDATGQQSNVAQAQNTAQLQNVIAQGQAPASKAGAQSLAGAMTQAQAQPVVQAAQADQQMTGQLASQGLQQKAAADQTRLQEKQTLAEGQIAKLQREGKLRQNSAALKQSKKLQANEIASQQRMTSAKIELDNSLSFLTRKQRMDLAELGGYTKQQLFDARLSFAKDEMGRKFSNSRQLADYAVASAESERELQERLQVMQKAAKMEIMAMEAANAKITQRIEMEFKKAENQKNYDLTKELQRLREANKEKIRRKQAKASGIQNIFRGVGVVAGAIIGAKMSKNPAGAAKGASAGAAVGGAAGTAAGGAYASSGALD